VTDNGISLYRHRADRCRDTVQTLDPENTYSEIYRQDVCLDAIVVLIQVIYYSSISKDGMEFREKSAETLTIQVENIGGISETTVEFSPGTTVLAGQNATNRTSLLQAIMAALGSDAASLKGDADAGHVTLDIGSEVYRRDIYRKGEDVVYDGDPYLSDPGPAELFAFLLETNRARRAVATNADLREIIMEPVDTDDIENQIEELRDQRDDIDDKIDEIDELKNKLPELEKEKQKIKNNIVEKRSELSELNDQIAEIDENVEKKRKIKERFDAALDEMDEARSDLESIRSKITTEQNSIDALRDEREELKTDLEEIDEIPEQQTTKIETETEQLRERRSRLDNKMDELQTVIQFNEDLLDDDLGLFGELVEDDDTDVTSQLLDESDDVVCWTCGSETSSEQIQSMLEQFRNIRDRYMSERGDITDQIEELNTRLRDHRETRQERARIQSQLEDVTAELGDRERKLETLTDRRSELEDRVQDLEAKAERLRDDAEIESELIELHKEASRLEVAIEQSENDLDRTDEEIAHIEDRTSERDELERTRESLQQELEELRTRVQRLEENAVDQFNDRMSDLLDILRYENLERVWIERTEKQVRRGRETVTEGKFTLHVVRQADSGAVYEDTVDHLSESEREVTGLVFALAGYLVHDVHESVPFMLLDSIEAIDAPRISALVNYFEEHVDYLVVALLEEDAQHVDSTHQIADV
jgi:DNA repair exonuclease SbcCD ATPase subunit